MYLVVDDDERVRNPPCGRPRALWEVRKSRKMANSDAKAEGI